MEVSIHAESAEELRQVIGGWSQWIFSEARRQVGDSIQIACETTLTKATEEQRRKNIGVFGLVACSDTVLFSEQKGTLAEVTVRWKFKSPKVLEVNTSSKVSNLPFICAVIGGIIGVVLLIGGIYLARGWIAGAWNSPDYRDIYIAGFLILFAAIIVILACGMAFGLMGCGLERVFMAKRVGECDAFTEKVLRPLVEAAVRMRAGK